MRPSRAVWIKAGYALFAKEGRTALNIERLATITGKARSSFYHNFYNLEVFEQELFQHHFLEAKEFLKEAGSIERMFPEYLDLFILYKDWVFFQKQLYLIRFEDAKYQNAFDRSRNITEVKTASLWVKTAGLERLPLSRTNEFFLLVRGAFYTRLNFDNYTSEVVEKIILDINDSFGFLLSKKLPKPNEKLRSDA